MKKEDVKVSVDAGILRIEGERKQEKEEKGKKYHRIERSYGSFLRTFTLPDNVDETKVQADFKDGMLNVRLRKAEKAQVHRNQGRLTAVSPEVRGDFRRALPTNAESAGVADLGEGPEALLEQLAPGGRLVIPIGDEESGQVFTRVTREGPAQFRRESCSSVAMKARRARWSRCCEGCSSSAWRTHREMASVSSTPLGTPGWWPTLSAITGYTARP